MKNRAAFCPVFMDFCRVQEKNDFVTIMKANSLLLDSD